jgi:hypothetical protein
MSKWHLPSTGRLSSSLSARRRSGSGPDDISTIDAGEKYFAVCFRDVICCRMKNSFVPTHFDDEKVVIAFDADWEVLPLRSLFLRVGISSYITLGKWRKLPLRVD